MIEQLYDVKTIARAMNLSDRSVQRYAEKGYRGGAPWVASNTVRRRGVEAQLFSIASLPADFRAAIRNLNRAEQVAEQHTADAAVVAEIRADEAAAALDSFIETDNATEKAATRARQKRRRLAEQQWSKLPKDSARRARALARRWVLLGAYQWRREHGGSNRDAFYGFGMAVTCGDIAVPDKYKSLLPMTDGRVSLVEGTIRNWDHQFRQEGMWGLVDGYGNRAGSSKIETNLDLYREILGAIQRKPHITPKNIKAWLAADKPTLNVVSETGIRRFIQRFRGQNTQLWTFITNPDRWKNVYMAAIGSQHESITRLNQLWELDSTPGDWLLEDGRHTVVGAIDLYSRRMKFFVSKTSTAAAVKQLMRRCLLDWGIPEAVRTDNGADYVSESVETVLHAMQIKHLVCIPFASEQKGTIERAMRTMSHGVLDLLPGFIGHNVAERKEIEARKSFAQRVMSRGESVEVALTSAELQTKLDEWVTYLYEESAHGGLDGHTPREIARAWRGEIRRLPEEDIGALDGLLAEIAGERVITKKGIRFDHRYYVDVEGTVMLHVGKTVRLLYDEHDIGRLAAYLPNEFLAWVVDPAATGISRAELAIAINRKQRKNMTAQAAEWREMGKAIKRDPFTAIIEHRKAEAGNVVDLPTPATPYTTPALREAKRAAASKPTSSPLAFVPPTTTSVDDPERDACEREAFKPAAVVCDFASITDANCRYGYWWRLDQRVHNNETLTAAEESVYRSYRNTTEFRTTKIFLEDFHQDPAAWVPEWAKA